MGDDCSRTLPGTRMVRTGSDLVSKVLYIETTLNKALCNGMGIRSWTRRWAGHECVDRDNEWSRNLGVEVEKVKICDS